MLPRTAERGLDITGGYPDGDPRANPHGIHAFTATFSGRLEELREDRGERPTVTVALHTSGRELDSEAALDRFLGELREQRPVRELGYRRAQRALGCDCLRRRPASPGGNLRA
jgi:hypothetical protein